MRQYELTIIVQPDLEEATRTESIERVHQWLIEAGADPEAEVKHWGQRSLAYPIEDYTSGYYVLFDVALDPNKIAEIDRNLRFRDEIIRHLFVRKEG